MESVESCRQLDERAAVAAAHQVERWWPEPPRRDFFDRLFGGSDEDVLDSAAGDNLAAAGAGESARDFGNEPAQPGTAAAPATNSEGAVDEHAVDDGVGTVIGTNNQEAAVDEADVVKTDGRRVVSLVDGVLRVVTLDGDPAVDGTLDMGALGARELFLRGDTVVVIGSGAAASPNHTVASRPVEVPPVDAHPGTFASSTSLSLVAIDDSGTPQLIDTAEVEGTLVAARSIGDTARVVVRSTPAVMNDIAVASDRADALERAHRVRGADMLPRVARDGVVAPAGDCTSVLLTSSVAGEPAPEFPREETTVVNGPSVRLADDVHNVTVLTVGEDLTDLAPVTIQGAAETVYASTAALYVAANGWGPDGSVTAVHRFGMDGDGPVAHSGSGLVPGRLLNQYSLSERAGVLRVVTTVDHPVSQGRLTNLDTDGALEEIGHLDGMGVGEEVKAVRFVDDLGYVVTFRRTDPLYALDLSDPAAPRMLGELKIPGFSQYLHPIGDGLLLGVGRDADEVTGAERGTKISLFSIADPTAMAELDQIVLPDTWTPVSHDHKAFLWDHLNNQAVIPVEGHGHGSALVVRVDGEELVTAAQLRHPTGAVARTPHRAFVVDTDLWTLSVGGLGRSDATAPATVEMISFQ